MDKIYKPQCFDCTEHINIVEYFNKYTNELNVQPSVLFQNESYRIKKSDENETISDEENVANQLLDEKIFSFINDSNYNIEKQHVISKVCSPDNLNIDEEIQPMTLKDINGSVGTTKSFIPYEYKPDSLNFETVKRYKNRPSLKRWLEEDTMNKKYFVLDNNVVTSENDLKPGVDFVVYVRFYQPFAYNYAVMEGKKYLSFDHEIILLGSNTLADLKDKIFCFANSAIITDVSNDLSTQDVLKAQEIYPSSFIFIDNIFYNDFRAPNSKDNSKVIRTWATQKDIGNFQTSHMNTTRIDALKPRFGYPYVYQHQGRCEHVFIFAQARLLNSQDCLSSKEYPYYSAVSHSRATFCYICGHLQAVWIVLDCERLPLNKTPLCNDCLKSYCYLGGKKIGTFKCYAFSNRKDLL